MTSGGKFSLLLFSVDAALVREAVRAGVEGIVVDWESAGKSERQQGADTEINRHSVEDLRRVRAATDGLVVCRIDNSGETPAEIERAIDAGADELLLPMVRGVREVEAVLDQVRGRCRVGILIETQDAVARASSLCALPLSRVYLGLNDLAIDRGAPDIFRAVLDGTVERVRRACPLPFGFGGLTLPDRGRPIPCRLLIAEMARLDADYSFLRRSFYRDVHGDSLALGVARILDAVAAARDRGPARILQDHAELDAAIEALTPSAGAVRREATA
jgi:hypothetical protein